LGSARLKEDKVQEIHIVIKSDKPFPGAIEWLVKQLEYAIRTAISHCFTFNKKLVPAWSIETRVEEI